MIITKKVDGHEVKYHPLTAKEGSERRKYARKHMQSALSIQRKVAAAGGDESQVKFTRAEERAIKDADKQTTVYEIGEKNIVSIDGKPWGESEDAVFVKVCDKLFGGNG